MTTDANRVSEGLNRAALANHLAAVLETQRIDCAIDVGAHHGQYGTFLRGIGHEGQIVSFEPIADSFAELEPTMAAHPPWVGHRLALAEASGEAEMSVYPSTDFSSLGPPTEFGPRVFPEVFREVRRARVPLRALDDLLPEIVDGLGGTRLLLKIDAQGSERGVLEGAGETLTRAEAVQIETAVKPLYEGALAYAEAIEILGSAGFELSGVFPVTRDPALRILELDLVLVKPESGR